jgi:hypothetical protein
MTQPANLPNPYGSDFWIGGTPLDLDPSMRLTSGRPLLSQNLVCRFSTPRGGAIDCPNDGLDLRDLVSDGMTQSQINALQGQIQQEALKDQRVQSLTVQCSFTSATSTLTVTLNVVSLYGPFQLTLAVTSLTVAILNANLPSATT